VLNVGNTGVALDKKTGKVAWFSGTEKSGYTTPVPLKIGNDAVVVMAVKADVVAVRVQDGKELWRFPWKTQYDVNAADPVLAGDKVFISSGYGHGAALFDVGAKPPKQIWFNKNMRSHFNGCVLWLGHLYGVDESQLRCLDLATGDVKWTDKASGKGSLILADGKLVVLSEKGELLVAEASPNEFKPTARAQVLTGKCWTAPTLANGRIYCRNAAGDLVCVDVSGKQVQ
jgi:outer membrane protein assembly factor BamB